MEAVATTTAPTSPLERLIGGYMALRSQSLSERLALAQVNQTATRTTVQQASQPGANPSPALASAAGATAAGVAGVPWMWIAVGVLVLVGVVLLARKG